MAAAKITLNFLTFVLLKEMNYAAATGAVTTSLLPSPTGSHVGRHGGWIGLVDLVELPADLRAHQAESRCRASSGSFSTSHNSALNTGNPEMGSRLTESVR